MCIKQSINFARVQSCTVDQKSYFIFFHISGLLCLLAEKSQKLQNKGLKTEITSMNFVFAWWHALNRYLPQPSPNAKGTRRGCNLQGAGCKGQVTVFHQPFSEVYFLQLIINSLHGPTTLSCQETGECRLHWTVS